MSEFKPKTLEELNAIFTQQHLQKSIDKYNSDAASGKEESAAEAQPSTLYSEPEPAPEPIPDENIMEKYISQDSDETEDTVPEAAFGAILAEEIFPETETETAPAEDSAKAEAEEETTEKVAFEFNEPDPHGYFGPPIDKSKPRPAPEEDKESEATQEEEPKFAYEKAAELDKAKKKSKSFHGFKIFSNTVICIIAVLSLVTGLLAGACSMPGKFIFGHGLLICRSTVADSNVTAGTLLLLKQSSSAADGQIAAYTTDDSYSLSFGRDIPDGASVFGIATRGVPHVGGFLSSVMNSWIVYLCGAIAVVLILLIIRTLLSDSDDKSTAKQKSKRNQ